jgi:hypothetical protein
LPSVTAAAHPVICIGEGDATDSVLARNSDRAFHATPGVQIAWPAVTVPSLEGAEGCDELRLGIDDNNSAFDHAHELGKTIQTVRVNAVAAGFGKKLCAKPSAVFLETQIDENFQEN